MLVSASFKSCPREGASESRVMIANRYKFQVMPPRGGIYRMGLFSISSILFQVMPPRGGIGRLLLQQAVVTHVSSHAPARGHLVRLRAVRLLQQSFKSCPREGASTPFSSASKRSAFQVMPPRGGIYLGIVILPPSDHVSSHAPARGHQETT